MSTKLTLTIDKKVIEKAKEYAKRKERSLSNIIENYLKSITDELPDDDVSFTPLVESLKGSFKAPKGFNYKNELKKALSKKQLDK